MSQTTLHIAEQDNVMVALRLIAGGTVVDGVTVATDVPAGHKIATRPIPAGQTVLKYGYPIGVATRDIAPGEHVHSHNLTSTLRDDFDPSKHEAHLRKLQVPVEQATFDGFRRPDGRVGVRNEIWIVNTVGCVNNAAERIAAAARKEMETGVGSWGSVDGVHAFPHQFGCSQLGDDLELTQKILAGLVRHPNAGAVLILGLGCENNQMKSMLESVGKIAPERVQYFNAQDVSDEVEEGIGRIRQLAAFAGKAKREPIPAKELILGMKCGGSDGLSGITANPLVGKIANRVAAAGGTVLLTEVPEMFGAEEVLLDRATSANVAKNAIDMVNNFRAYFRKYNQPIDENPAPGNKAGGITTLAEKSLGCVQKGGDAPVAQVLGYGETAPVGLGGIGLINAPGNDGVSSTAMVAAGAHILLFTTGRGTPLGFPSPTIKISTNSDLAAKKTSWIDFDAGPIALGTSTFEELGPKLYQLVLDVASGRTQTKNERNGFREIAIWKDGVTL
jgi:altronate hydrolase